jgi:hypothetical protein
MYRGLFSGLLTTGLVSLGGCGLADIFGRQEVQESLRHVTLKYHLRNSFPPGALDVINNGLDQDPGLINTAAVTGLATQPVCEVTDRTGIHLNMYGDPPDLMATAVNTNSLELTATQLQDDSGGACTLPAVDNLTFVSGQSIHIDEPMPVSTLEIDFGGERFTAAGQHARVILDGFTDTRFATGKFQFLAKRKCDGLSGNEYDNCSNDPRVLIVFNGVFAEVD